MLILKIGNPVWKTIRTIANKIKAQSQHLRVTRQRKRRLLASFFTNRGGNHISSFSFIRAMSPRVSSNRVFISSRRSLRSSRRKPYFDTVQKNDAAIKAITVTDIVPIQKCIDKIIFWTLPRCRICSFNRVDCLSFSSSRSLSVMFSIVYYQEYSRAAHSASRDVNIPGGFLMLPGRVAA